MEFSLIENLASLKEMKEDWDDLYGRSDANGFFQSFAWQWAAAAFWPVRGDGALRVLVGKSEGRVSLIWPLILCRRHGFRVIRWLGYQTYTVNDLLVVNHPERTEWIEQAWDFLKARTNAHVAFLDRVKGDAKIAPFLGRKAAVVTKTTKAPFVDWGAWENWEQYRAAFPRKLLSDDRRQEKRLRALGKLSFVVAETVDETKKVVDWMAARKGEWFRRTHQTPPWSSVSEYRRFLTSVATAALLSGQLFLGSVLVDDTLIAALLGFHARGRFAAYLFTYDNAWQSYSPGRLAMLHALQWSKEQSHVLFDFMPEPYAFKYRFTDRAASVNSYLVALNVSRPLLGLCYRARLHRVLGLGCEGQDEAAVRNPKSENGQ